MNYQVGTACYPTPEAAASVSASASLGAIVHRGGDAYSVDASSVNETSITYTLTPITGGAPITTTVPYTAQPCQLLTMQDGLQMGWGVAAAWIGVYALMFLSRAFRGDTESTYGNT